MHIKNKYLRLITSCFIALALKYMVAFFLSIDNMAEPYQALLAWFLFLFFFAIPIYVFMVVKINEWLTPIEDRGNKKDTFSKMNIAIFLTLMSAGLLFFLATLKV